MGRTRSSLGLALLLVLLFDHLESSEGQRSLNYWKRDLEHRIRLYESNHDAIKKIIASSIYAPQGNIPMGAPEVRVSASGNVRFSDLIIPAGAIRLSPHILQPTINILVTKTKSYADSKANELSLIQDQLNNVVRQLDDPSQQFIYKGVRGQPQPQKNFTHLIRGTRVFRQTQYAHFVETMNATVQQINMTDVSRVIDDTYWRNIKLGVYDSQNRLFFEGRKTFWDTVFSKPLRSGCCDRLWPLHTSRMMLRSVAQDVAAPILIHSRDSRPFSGAPAAHIRDLRTQQLYNRPIELAPVAPSRPDDLGLLPPSALPSNLIQLPNLINIRQLGQPEVLKTLVFKSPVMIDEALLANSYADNRLVIGIATIPGFAFDLAHDNYLLKFTNLPGNFSHPMQQVSGALVLDAETNFFASIHAAQVNRVSDFARFIRQSVVHTNRPATIRGPVQFNALPTMLDMSSPAAGPRRPQNVLILHAREGMQVGQLNGMRIPQDLVILASNRVPGNERVAIKPGQQIRVRGTRNFANQLVCLDALQVAGSVNGMEMPSGVIPLHLNDAMSTTGQSNLWFMDGVSLQHVSVAGGHFDDIKLNDVNGGAQSIVLNSMSVQQSDGTTLIRAPLRVKNLHLINSDPAGRGPPVGRLNGFRPQEVLELNARYPFETLYGRKHFAGHVEATECIFDDINKVPNWTNHLIRIDRPNTLQTVHTKLVFTSAPRNGNMSSNQPPDQLNLQRLNVEFQSESEPAHYEQNWNFSPELYLLHQALMRQVANYTGGRYRVLDELKLIHPSGGLVNNIPLGDIVRLDQPFRFADTFTMVGKVEVLNSLRADRIQSNYPIDALDLVQFDKYRIPTLANSRAPIRLNSLTLAGPDNKASFVHSRLLNGVSLNDFLRSIMSLTRPQTVAGPLQFQAPVSFEGMVRTTNHKLAAALKTASFSFEDGLQCSQLLVGSSLTQPSGGSNGEVWLSSQPR